MEKLYSKRYRFASNPASAPLFVLRWWWKWICSILFIMRWWMTRICSLLGVLCSPKAKSINFPCQDETLSIFILDFTEVIDAPSGNIWQHLRKWTLSAGFAYIDCNLGVLVYDCMLPRSITKGNIGFKFYKWSYRLNGFIDLSSKLTLEKIFICNMGSLYPYIL